jgi:hypothetical protein
MPDASGGLATGMYWIATGKLPLEDLAEDDKEDGKPDSIDRDMSKDPQDQKDKKSRG